MFTYDALALSDDQFHKIRKAIFHSTGPGYYLFKAFLTPEQTDHLRDVWLRPEAMDCFQPLEGKHQFHFGCSNYYSYYGDGHRVFYNFPWNVPLDDLTFSSTFLVQLLRNRIEGQMAFYEIFPFHSSRAVSYRVANTRNIDVWADWHRDYYDKENLVDKKSYLLNRVQATLFLSKYGIDYEGEGFCFETNQGEMQVAGRDIDIDPGDLMIWRYNNLHGVRNIVTREDQLGFLRVLYPPEFLYPVPSMTSFETASESHSRQRTWKALAGRVQRFLSGTSQV